MITAGTIDTSFVIGSGFINDFDDCLIYTTKLQSDGKILVGGNFTSYDGNTAYHLIRLNPDGSVDNTFDYGPYLTHNGSGNPAYVKSIEIESDGKILVGGYFDTYNGIPTGYIIRLNTDGSVSDYFNSGFNKIVRSIKVQSDGKILVGGDFDVYNSDTINLIARLNTNGSLDTTFGTGIGNGFNDSVFSIEIENNGKILVGGDFTNYNGINTNYIVRLDQAGSIFNTFNSGFNNRVQKIVLQPDGKILCGGQFDDYNGTQSRFMIRLNPNCTIDTLFNFNDWVIDMCLQPDGRIVVVGKFNEVIDTVYGQTFNPEYIIRLNPSGSVDNSFYPVILSGGFNNDVNSVMLESNGNILVGGWFTDYFGESYNRLISLNNDELIYTYQYVYEVGICSNNQFIEYYVGSNVELSPEINVTISDINNPSFVRCGFVNTFNLAQTPTYEYVITNNNCNECLSANSQIALVQSCVDPEIGGPILVSNQYQIGEILYIDETYVGEGSFTIRGCFTIVDVTPYDSEFGSINNIINYQPQQSCESCIACNGAYYIVEDCNIPEPTTNLILSNQLLNFGDVIYYPNGETPCKQVIDVVIEAPSFAFDNPEIINSTLVYDNCGTCLNLNTWTEQIQGNGIVDFNNPIPAPFDNWGIIGPDNDSCNPGWTYVKYQVTQSGSLTLFYDFTTSTDLCCDWPFYYVSPNEPIGSTNINFSVAGSGNIFGPNYGTTPGDITINYNAGDWISIGVYSTDCVEGPGVLFISAPQIQESLPYSLHNFTTCDGPVGYVTVPNSFDSQLVNVSQISYSEITSDGLDLMPLPGDCDDDFIQIPFPTDFSSNFLCETYDSVYMGTNSYITFGGGSGNCCFTIPNEIPTGDGTGLPGVYISTSIGNNPLSGLDNMVINWYSGLTNGGDNFVIRYEGTYLDFGDDNACECIDINDCPPLVYSFVFYKNEPNYFDLVIESNTYFYNNNPTGGVSNGINSNFLGTFNSSSQISHRITTTCPIIQGNIGSTATVCGTIGSAVSGITTPSLGGSIYFNSNEYSTIQIDNTSGDFGFGGGNDLTVEWFQYWEGGLSAARPFSIGTYPATVFLQISFESNGLLWVGDGIGGSSSYNLGFNLSEITNTWVHFAITRNFNGVDRVWRVFVNGVMVLEQVDNTIATTNLPLIIGNQIPTDGQFQGYITNFRVNNLTSLYLADFPTPTAPLENIPNTILLLLATDSPSYLTDTSGQQDGNITTTGLITWSELSPFIVPYSGLFYSDGLTTYNSCSGCTSTINYKVTLKNCKTNEITYVGMNPNTITLIQENGFIFSNGTPDCYELLDVCEITYSPVYTPIYFYTNCADCLEPLTSGTESLICEICCDCGATGSTVNQITPPHPIWTNQYGKAVSQLNMVTLGGPNGLNN